MLSFMTDPEKLHAMKLAIALLVYEVIFQLVGTILTMQKAPLLHEEGFALLVSGFLALFITLRILGIHRTYSSYDHLTILKYLCFLLMVYGLQAFSTLLINPVADFLKSNGYSLEHATEIASGNVTGFWLLLYSVLGAPLIEELAFRGIIFGSVRRYGRIFAILISALLFGLMHLNIVQFTAAFLIGILFGYIRDTYGLPAAVLMHISNNTLAIISNNYGSKSAALENFFFAFILCGMASVIVFLISSRSEIHAAFQAEKNLGRHLRNFFTTPAVILLIALFLFLTTLNLS